MMPKYPCGKRLTNGKDSVFVGFTYKDVWYVKPGASSEKERYWGEKLVEGEYEEIEKWLKERHYQVAKVEKKK